jgi:hypothetical protein
MKQCRLICGTKSMLLFMAWFTALGCQPVPPPPAPAGQELPPAYTSRQITDPTLRQLAEELQNWALKQVGLGGQPLYSRAEVLAPVQTVMPYGVGAYQQEPRLPVILTTGPGWAGLARADKEAKVAEMFRTLTAKLETFKVQPPLRPTLTIQTPQGLELGWINYLDPNGKNLHGDE